MKQYPFYKDSGVQWIGKIPEHWEVKRLKSIASFINRGNAPSYIESGNIAVINQATFSSGAFDFSKLRYTEDCELDAIRGRVLKDDVLLASTGGGVLGKTALVDFTGDYMADSHVTIIRDAESRFNPKFLYLFLSVNYNLINGILAQGSTNQTELQRKWLADFKIPFPDKVEQTAIASFLDHRTTEIDQLIAAKEELIAKLEAQRKAIINEAVTGQAYKTGLIPTPDGKEVKFKDSGIEWLGEIPEHWDIKKVKHLSQIISKGTTPTTEGREMADSGIRYLKAENIKENMVSENPEFYIDEETNEILKRSQLVENDILFVIAGATIGKCAVLQKELLPANTNQAVSFIRLKENENHHFVYYWLTSPLINQQVWFKAVTSAQPNLSMGNLGNLLILYPPPKEQLEIVNSLTMRIATLDDLISKINVQNGKLKDFRQSLITEAVTGKIDVRDWQKDYVYLNF